MTREEFKSYIEQLVANPDKIPETLLVLQEGVEGLYSENESYGVKVGELETKVADLRDSNTKLFLRTTGKVEPEPEEPEVDFDALMAERILGENDGNS